MKTIKKTIELDLWDDIVADINYALIVETMITHTDGQIEEGLFSDLIDGILATCRDQELSKQTKWLMQQMQTYSDCETPEDKEPPHV